ncbi:MAG: hypothetical protein JNJ55_07955 [Betaproteobacteria bacterium]|nr:hypothetical protein [Betaproteobacteria bacterium]
MKLLWSRKESHAKITPHPTGRALDGIAIDFLRMIGAAIASGLVISIVAATLAMLLSRTADAAPSTFVSPTQESLAYPGVLAVGMGCDSVPIEATDRDWWVKIEGRRATVRVMQSFLMPEDSEGSAVFTAVLPKKAALLSLSLQTTQADFDARILTSAQSITLDADAYREFTRQSLLATIEPNGEVTTSPLPGLEESRVVTVTYTYSVPVEISEGKPHLTLPLTETRFSALDALMEPDTRVARNPRRGAVWVEWSGALPRRVDGAPTATTFERAAGRIEALSWESQSLAPGARFQLNWAS